jgi:lysophospholipase L1-like esterase
VGAPLQRQRARLTWLRRGLAGLLAAALGTCLALLVLELGLRLFGGAPERARTRYRFDPRYGDVPADSFVHTLAIDPARHHAVDLRGQLVPLHKPADELRVLFVGDSVTEGAFVPPERAYPRRFEALAHARAAEHRGRRVRAINAGVWGMTTLDALHLLRDKLLPLAPDVVVLGLFLCNDVNMNLAHGRKRRQPGDGAWLDALRQRSALVQASFVQALALNQRLRLFTPGAPGSDWIDERLTTIDARGLHLLSYPSGELALYVRGRSALLDQAYAILGDALLQLKQLGHERGFTLRVLVIPSPSTVLGRLAILAHPGLLVELQQQGVRVDPTELDFGQPLRRVLGLCEELSLPCVDATPALRTVGRAAFFARDEHPTIAGHEALARALLGASP